MSEILEQHLAEELGVPRTVLRDLRGEMEKSRHWIFRAEGIALTDEGRAYVTAKLARETPPAPEVAPEPVPAPKNPAQVVWVRLTRVFPINPRLMEGETLGAENTPPRRVRVLCASSRYFVPRMELPCLPSRQVGVVRYAGPLPRSKGRLHRRVIEQYLQRMGVA